MSQSRDVMRARQMLTEQLDALGSLRNASTRDPNFKQWRQNTLTAIQRIWSGDPSRGERFRRVPFSAPSSRADVKQVREYYERGCAEAATYLRALLAEIELVGVPGQEGTARPASLEPGIAEDDFPTVDLPGGPPRVTPAPPPAPPVSRPVFEMPGLNDPEPVEPPKARTPRAPVSRPVFEMPGMDDPEPADAPKARAPRAPAGKATVRGGRNGRKNGHKPRLKDMLGFTDEESAAPAEAAGPTDDERVVMPATPAAPLAPLPPTPSAEDADPDATPEPGVVEMPLEGAGDAPVTERETAGAEADVERAMEDFLRLSPVFSSQARPVKRRLPAGTGPFSAPAALALAALAADIEALDVPEGHRARARATLLDLARHMDTHDLSWESLRDGVNFAMEFPAIGRRVLPLLVPYLDQAA